MLNTQKGAIFGLDARITLAIFTVISVISAATLTVDMSRISGGALTEELHGFGDAVEGLHSDMKMDIYKTLIKPNSENAYIALYDDTVIQTGVFRPRWLGPYVKTTNNIHPKYGKMKIEKQGREHSASCHPSQGCFLWLTLDSVGENIILEVNDTFDGEHEDLPPSQGRIQWSTSEESSMPNNYRLWYRIAPAIQ